MSKISSMCLTFWKAISSSKALRINLRISVSLNIACYVISCVAVLYTCQKTSWNTKNSCCTKCLCTKCNKYCVKSIPLLLPPIINTHCINLQYICWFTTYMQVICCVILCRCLQFCVSYFCQPFSSTILLLTIFVNHLR